LRGGSIAPTDHRRDLGTLWTLTKDGHAAIANVREIEGVGFELRYLWDGDLRSPSFACSTRSYRNYRV
jgi:hypothetical protein